MSEPVGKISAVTAWHLSTPKRMAESVMERYRGLLLDHGEGADKLGLINALAAEKAAPASVGLPELPADEALRVARSVIADAYNAALRAFKVPSVVINAIEDRVFADLQVAIEIRARMLAAPIDEEIRRLRKRGDVAPRAAASDASAGRDDQHATRRDLKDLPAEDEWVAADSAGEVPTDRKTDALRRVTTDVGTQLAPFGSVVTSHPGQPPATPLPGATISMRPGGISRTCPLRTSGSRPIRPAKYRRTGRRTL
ncbi:hypothetical protein [Actinomadura rupiterrae]|uniref:hypothetical protein n=1 Tax=Actinomadura rupiterrae TaxID=559627 RepID=UPI0020A5DABD|nr:hypothetical protein [Actinomadura rupiterrae]MCP2336954.1 hypothetical protein [Actinomadura rupiterrae]